MSQLKALIFDVDGTLANTERDGHRVAFNRAFAEAGLAWEWSVELYQELLEVAGGKERIRFYRSTYDADWYPEEDLFIWSAQLHAAKSRHYQQMLVEGMIPLRLGVERLLQSARDAGVRLAIATTSTPENVSTLLKANLTPDALNWFEVIAAGDIVPAKKPAPDIYLYALTALALEPESCLAIEDSNQGLRAATQAGLKTVITCNEYTQQQDFSSAILVLDSLGERDRPFQVIRGNAHNAQYFDLDLARKLIS
jgi:HAD superfamily hydrolase (TIGR01509 family)